MDKTTQIIDVQAEKLGTVAPKIQIPGYKILRELGRGGMAHVYLAVQESFGREVALKILSPHLSDDEQFSKRFLREARIVSQLNHPNIITVYDAGKHEQHNYMSMEYIPGKDLKQLKDTISREDTLRIVKDVAAALDFAGKKGIVHRDVKPENIMLHQADNRVILMDFGIAHGDDVTQGMTQTGRAIGTPHFMSPEQTKGLKVDHRSDIYSLGIVLFQLLSGNLPFDADSAVAVGIKHLTAPIPLLPAGLEIFQPIINRCLSKQPKHRYQKAAELVTALNNISDEQLDNINTQAETQMSDVPVVRNKNTIPDIVFPSANKKSLNKNIGATKPKNNLRRNILFLILIGTATWAGNENKKELTSFWAYTVLPEIVKISPDLFPKSYSEYWAEKLQPKISNKTTKHVNIAPKQVSPVTLQAANIAQATPSLETNAAPLAFVEKPTQKDKIIILKEGLKDNPDNAIELVAIYKDMLLQNKENPIARKGLKELREGYIQKIRLAFSIEDVVFAREQINLVKKSFPRAAKNKRFIRLEKKVAYLERINKHYVKAKKHFSAGALSKPSKKNALYEIQIILKLSPNNENAINLKKNIATSYIEKTIQLEKQGNLHNALLMIEEAIAALNKNPALIKKRKQVQATIKSNNKISLLFKVAKKYQVAGQLINPQSYNAYDLYQEILHIEKNNLEAKAGLNVIHQQLAKKITISINKGHLKESKENLQAALQRYGRSSLLASVQLKLDDAQEAIAPKIEAIIVSTTHLTRIAPAKFNASLNDIQTLKLKGRLHIGFSFINFDPKPTWLEVSLLDTTKNTVVMQKPVVVSSQFGEHFFEIQLPLKSLSNSLYKVEIKLKEKVLISHSFFSD